MGGFAIVEGEHSGLVWNVNHPSLITIPHPKGIVLWVSEIDQIAAGLLRLIWIVSVTMLSNLTQLTHHACNTNLTKWQPLYDFEQARKARCKAWCITCHIVGVILVTLGLPASIGGDTTPISYWLS